MTRHDLKIAAIIAAVVLVLGWGIGFLVGTLTRPAHLTSPEQGQGDPDRPVQTEQLIDGKYPGYQELYVNDYAGLLTRDAEGRIRQKLIDLYRGTDIEMTVLTIPQMSDYGHHGAIEPFATGLFNAWGIGDAQRNDGVLILIARYDREMRIEIGRGYGRDWNGRMKRVIDTAFLPAFRQDEYQQGIENGVDATILELTGALPGQQDSNTALRGWTWIWFKIKQFGEWAWALLLVPLGGGALAVRSYLRNRPRACDECGTMMQRLDEQADDAFLDDGQQTEEFLKSVDYDVWNCGNCGHMDIRRYRGWFSFYGSCPRCNYRTLSSDTTILVAATTSSAGRKRIDYDCGHCDYKNSVIRSIPRKSSNSSSGGSSFGGGSSSGGGASGSW
jgi:uncharacterized protein